MNRFWYSINIRFPVIKKVVPDEQQLIRFFNIWPDPFQIKQVY